MLEAIFGNPHYKLASIGLAVLTWLYVQSDELHEEPLKAQIDWTLAPGLVSIDPLPTQLTLRVRGTRAAIRRARDQDQVEVSVDISDIGPGEHNLDFEPFPTNISSTLEVLGRLPSGVRFELDEVSQRKVKIRPVVVGEPAPGYAVESIVLAPAVATLSGPGVTVTQLTEVQTAPIDLTGLAGNASIPVELDLPRSVEEISGQPVSAEIEILAQNAQRTWAEVPVYVWENTRYRPVADSVRVTLQGPSAQLKSLSAEDLVAFVHLPAGANEPRYEAAWGPKDGLRLRILHAHADRLEVTEVEPSRVEVQSR